VGSRASLCCQAVTWRFLERGSIRPASHPAEVGVDHAVNAQPTSGSPGRAGSTEPPRTLCQGPWLAESLAASGRAGVLVGFTYGK